MYVSILSTESVAASQAHVMLSNRVCHTLFDVHMLFCDILRRKVRSTFYMLVEHIYWCNIRTPACCASMEKSRLKSVHLTLPLLVVCTGGTELKHLRSEIDLIRSFRQPVLLKRF